MSFDIERHTRNVHQINVPKNLKQFHIAMLSDIHWDNPKCDWEVLRKDLDYCKLHNIPIHINGDFFCLMQGRGDHRRSKSDIRPEHNNSRYLDSIVDTALEFWSPYAENIVLISYGNHETSIIRYQESDLLSRFVDLMNYKNGTSIQKGGYGGWLNVKFNIRGNVNILFYGKYFHGSGGGGIITKGNINLSRALQKYEQMDFFAMGHVHENLCRTDVRETLRKTKKLGQVTNQKEVHLMITGCYKEEYSDGFSGWHVERGQPIKCLGGRILTLQLVRKSDETGEYYQKFCDSKRFPR